ncbi:MAG TPA: CHAT domain-containing protein, partial [Thermoanaerobaculia bacterium]|nr:CHAT domain-containing protein [Thermoanaerobaculia bacterium]
HLLGQSGERGNCASVLGLFADTWRQLGEPHRAWSFRRDALAEMGEISHPRRLRPLANETAEALASQQRPDVALYFHDLGIWAARGQGDATALAQFLQRRALLRHRLGDRAGFAKDMADARRFADAITSPTRSRIQADLFSIQVEVEGPSAAGSLTRLDQAIAIYEQAGERIPLARLYLARGRGWHTAGDLEKAESDFGAAVREYEIPRGRLANPLRTSYLDQAHEAFEEMIALQLERGRPDLALQFSEQGRARTLADRQVTSGGAAAPLPAGDLPALLPPATVLIEISVLADRLVAWVIRSDGIGPALELPLPRQELETLVTLLHAEIAGNRPELSAARRLFEEIVQPLQSRIQPGEALIFVPEESLLAVPFAALEDPATGRFLVEDHAVGVAPSAAAYLHALRRSRHLAASAAPRPALFVGDPAFDPALFPSLSRLPHARAEAAALASRYPGATVLREDRARKDRILPGLGEYGVLHIASHALIHPELPLRSRFALAPGGGDSGSLTAGELGAVPLPHTRLAVLSACRTGGGERIGAEGASSLVWPFLAAGVPAVVASLWDVDDMSTAGLMSSFHERLQAGDDPWSALREAQLRSRAAGAPIAAWAAFQVYGGGDIRHASNAVP